MGPYPVIIFDFDGTLCATEDAILYTFKKAFEEKNITPPSPEKIKQAIGTGANLAELLPILHPPLQEKQDEAELQEWVNHYRHLYDTDGGRLTTLFPGAENLIAHLKEQGITCVVISNKGQRAIEDALDRFQLRQHFDLILGDNPEVPFKKKPDPMAYEKVIKPRYPQFASSQILMVGDTDADLLFANNAGLTSCWAAYGYGAKESCNAANPKFTIQSLDELYPIIAHEA
ncbi:HAD family hydrolase [Rufibacter tibetensis]|uniref:phosphoglycolate phosphatase n=1 Tax=Rufibacter tibetensis TaxID=512763 RepID=A0A0P0D1Z5_9BACT|nr:HAD family hydrolase [Rufibacter tibetensis]ALJ01130.1 hypothetical protein DC20_01910 [Rufibacter tibetensis]